MSIATYSDLKQAVSDWTARDDISTKVDDFIKLAEVFLSSELKNRKMLAQTTFSTVASTSLYDLPSDLSAIKNVRSSGYKTLLDQVEDAFIDSQYTSSTAGAPSLYAIDVPDNKIKLAPIPDAVYTITLTYIKDIPNLNVSNTTNWLLDARPDIYLNAVLSYAYIYIKDNETAQFHQQIALQLLDGYIRNLKNDALQNSTPRSQLKGNIV